jgi:hypothetical protein
MLFYLRKPSPCTPIVSVSKMTSSFESTTNKSSRSAEDLQPEGVSKQTTIIVASILTTAIILATVVGTVHCIRHRRRRQANEKRQQDVERSLQRARPPMLTLDTDLPIARQFTRSAGHVALSDLSAAGNVLNMPQIEARTAPSFSRPGDSSTAPARARNATRTSFGLYPPALSGRDARRRVSQDGTFERMGFTPAMQTPHLHDMRACNNA